MLKELGLMFAAHRDVRGLPGIQAAMDAMTLRGRWAAINWLVAKYQEHPRESCQCPAKYGENCPLTNEECDARWRAFAQPMSVDAVDPQAGSTGTPSTRVKEKD